MTEKCYAERAVNNGLAELWEYPKPGYCGYRSKCRAEFTSNNRFLKIYTDDSVSMYAYYERTLDNSFNPVPSGILYWEESVIDFWDGNNLYVKKIKDKMHWIHQLNEWIDFYYYYKWIN